MTAREILIDSLNDIDSAFIKEHMAHKTETPAQKFLRYAMPVAIYAAACVAVFLLIPFITGHSPDTPPVDPAVSGTYATETVVTADSEETSVTEESTVTTTGETSTDETTEAPAIETEDIVLPPETVAPPAAEEPRETVTVPAVTTTPPPQTTTTAVTTTEPVKPTPPKGMAYIADATIPYYVIDYDYKLDFATERNETLTPQVRYTNYNDFKSFTDKCKTKTYPDHWYPNYHYPDILDSWEYFGEEFFKKYDIYFIDIMVSSGSIYYYMTDLSMGNNGTLIADFDFIEPGNGMVSTCDLKETTHLIVVEKKNSEDSAYIAVRETIYEKGYSPYTGEIETVLKARLPERNDSYMLKSIPVSLANERLGTPVVMRNNDDFVRFRDLVSELCNGDTTSVFDEYYHRFVSYAETTPVFLSYDYVCLGVYDYDYILDNGGIKVDIDDYGIMNIKVPVSENKDDATKGRLHLWVLQFTKNVLNGVKEVNIIETASTKAPPRYAVCPKCEKERLASDIFVESIHPEYKQTGSVILFVKNSITREIFKLGPDTTDVVMERYLSDLELDKMSSSNYSGNPGLVEDIITGKHIYKLPISFTLTDKSIENLTAVLSSFGCEYCSDFELGAAIY